MNRFCVLVALLGASLLAHAVPNLELKETPPLKPLHYCKSADGQVTTQIEDCPLGTTEVSSITTVDGSGKATNAPLGTTMDSPAPAPQAAPAAPPVAASAAPATADDKEVLRKGRKSLLKALAFGLVFAVVARLMRRSMILGFVLGIALNIVLVAAAVIAP